jgi:hypothetical protein
VRFEAEPSLRLWAVHIELAGRRYRIPPLPASDWLLAVAAPSLGRIVPGMLERSDDADEILDLVLDGTIPLGEWQEASRSAIATISGTKWWSAARLTAYLLAHWGTVGAAVLARVNPSTEPYAKVLVHTYRILLENCKDEQERQRLDMELDRPPAGLPVAEMIDQQQAAANFMALANAPG